MITVNLLPYELRPIKRTPVPYILGVTILVLVVFAVLSVFVANQRNLGQANSDLVMHTIQLQDLDPVVQEYNTLTQKQLQLAEQVNTINEIVSDRIIWSRQLYNLARLALDNLWYDGMRVSMKTFTDTHSVYNPQTKKNELVKRTMQRQVLTVSGYVMAGTDGKNSISPFTLVTEQDEEFAELFQLDLSTFKDTMFEGVAVREFELEYIVSPGGAAP